MNIWISIVIAGFINYLTRLGSVLLIKPERLSDGAKKILSFVPSAVFPAIIFPAVFLNETNSIVQINDPKIIGFLIAVIIGYVSKNIVITIICIFKIFYTFVFYFFFFITTY